MTSFSQHPTLPGSRQHSLSGSRSLCFSSASEVSFHDDIPSSDSEPKQIIVRGQVTRHNSQDQIGLASPPCVVGLTLINVSAAGSRERMMVMSKPASRGYEAYFAPLLQYPSKSCQAKLKMRSSRSKVEARAKFRYYVRPYANVDSLSLESFFQKRQDAVKPLGNYRILHCPIKPMPLASHGNQFMLDSMAFQLLGHQNGLLEWNVFVVAPWRSKVGG